MLNRVAAYDFGQQLVAGFIGVDRLVFSAMIGKDALAIFRPTDEPDIDHDDR